METDKIHCFIKIGGCVLIYRCKDKNITQGNLAELLISPATPIWYK